ncbi:gamma-glutamyl-gamma-aminobutyrate hydrolase family protein [Mycoplasmatota bacterium]|nr:gamma-glutamyl-gamma-aminobutyrate hydrolase family protein [Mycoplasmatota bacterium]
MTLIGISSLNKKINRKTNMRLPISYINSVKNCGGIPIGIPVVNDETYIGDIVNKIDGLIIPGGDDINPKLFHEETNSYTKGIDDELDEFQIKLVLKALEKDIPLLGICRGHQVLNVALSGSLYQDISELKRDILIVHNQLKYGYDDKQIVHQVRFKKNSILEKLYGEKIMTNSFHHQIIKQLGDGLKAIGHTRDGVVEAMISKNHRFVVSVQWHPERSEEQFSLFRKFIEACNK